MILTTAVISILSSLYILPLVIGFISANNKTVKNYRNKTIYCCGGLFLCINLLLFCSILLCINSFIYNAETNFGMYALIIGIFSASFTGYIDDNSNDDVKGIRGHFESLRNKKLTSGVIKALIGVLTSLTICLNCRYRYIDFGVNFLIIPLSQNFMNLLDLKPARSIKAFLLLSMILLLSNINNYYLYTIIFLLVSLLFYLPYELGEIVILGDTGSNLLGIVLGVIMSSIDNLPLRLSFLLFLIIVHIYAERKSINLLVERNQILRFIDMAGRRRYCSDKNTEGNSQESNQ